MEEALSAATVCSRARHTPRGCPMLLPPIDCRQHPVRPDDFACPSRHPAIGPRGPQAIGELGECVELPDQLLRCARAVGTGAPGPVADRRSGENREARPCAGTPKAEEADGRAQGPKEEDTHGSRHHAPAARQRRALRSPDPSLEPEDEALHLHRAQRHLHRRPDADAHLHRLGLRVRQADRGPRRHDPVRRHQEAGPGVHPRAGHPRRHALREPALARRHAHQPPDRLLAREPPQGARAARLRGCGRLRLHQEGAAHHAPREGQARAHPRRHPRHGQDPLGRVDRGHQQGAPGRRRGAQAQHPRRRDPRHQLRPRRGQLPDPGQR